MGQLPGKPGHFSEQLPSPSASDVCHKGHFELNIHSVERRSFDKVRKARCRPCLLSSLARSRLLPTTT